MDEETAAQTAEEKAKKIPALYEFDIAGRRIDLRPVLPLTIGDWKHLKAKGITSRSADLIEDPAKVADLVLYAIRKVDTGITQADVDTLHRVPVLRIVKAIYEAEEAELPDEGRPT